jgi:hypothetical protein
LVSSRYITPIADIYDIKAFKCNADHIQQAEIFRAQHMAYHAITMDGSSLLAMNAVDEHKQVVTEQLLLQPPDEEELSLIPFQHIVLLLSPSIKFLQLNT